MKILDLCRLGAVFCAVLLVACSEPPARPEAGAEAAPTAASVRSYDAEALFRTITYLMPAGYAFSADGDMLLVTSDESGVFNAQAIDRATGDSASLTESASHAVFAQSFFPRDGRLLYSVDEGGNELDHVLVRELDGSTRDLTPGENLRAEFLGWLADGSGFFIASNERDPRRFDLYRYDSDGYQRALAYDNVDGWDLSAVSRDGRWLALTRNNSSADSDLFLADLREGGRPRLLTAHDGNIAHSAFTFTPDGAGLVFGTDAHGEFQQAWMHDIASGQQTPLVVADWDVLGVTYSTTGRYRASYVNRDALTVLELVDSRSGEPVVLPEVPEGEVLNVRFNADDTLVTFLINGDTRPSDLFVVDLAVAPQQREGRAYTHAMNPEIDSGDLVEGRVVRYRSFDGLEIPAILYQPHQASAEHPVPALVLVHGGPGGQTTRGYSAMVQHLVNHGYAVLGANNRGSQGYGKTFFHMDDRHHGEKDLRDIVAGRTYLESLQWVDGEHIGVIGGSYGGYMTAAAMAFHPEAFDVGIDIFGVTNWLRTLSSMPPWWGAFREALLDEMGDPETDGERLRRISPLFHASNVTKPMLVIQGANDPRVLQVESDELVAALRANDVPVEYLVFDDEGHGFRKRDNRIAASEAYVGFLDRYLKGP